jgi:phospholipid/cholesterol/gamma-HCH transport system permease protein
MRRHAPQPALHLRWQPAGDGWALHLCAATAPAGAAPDPAALSGRRAQVHADLPDPGDPGLAAAAWAVLAPLQRQGLVLDLQALPPALRATLELALAQASPAGADDASATAPPRNSWQLFRDDALDTLAFLGEVLLALGRVLRPGHRPRVLRGRDLALEFDLTGPGSLLIVALTCFLVGLMLAYMGGAQLERIGGQSFIAAVVTVGMVRELAGLMTGVILAGRVGAAFAAQLATMQANEEIDALRTLGIDPVEHLVLPRLLAMLAAAPLLIAFAMLVGVLAGGVAASGVYGVPWPEYLQQSQQALTWTHLWIGLAKGVLYVALVALAGCREGLHAGRNAQAVGEATTRAVVKALVWIVVAASASTALLQSLGF